MATGIVSAFVSHNAVPASEIISLLTGVYGTLTTLAGGGGATAQAGGEERPQLTSAQIKKSITPDALISFEDGRQYKSLKRHLATRGMTPEQYRAKWGLPTTYPMTAPNYSAQRSELAKKMGLGQQRQRAAAAAQAGAEKGKGRRKAA